MSMAQGSSRARKSALVSKDFSAVSEGLFAPICQKISQHGHSGRRSAFLLAAAAAIRQGSIVRSRWQIWEGGIMVRHGAYRQRPLSQRPRRLRSPRALPSWVKGGRTLYADDRKVEKQTLGTWLRQDSEVSPLTDPARRESARPFWSPVSSRHFRHGRMVIGYITKRHAPPP